MPDLNLIGTQSIETDRLLLRRFSPDDAKPMYANWACDPEVTRYLLWDAHASEAVSSGWIHERVKEYDRNDVFLWAIVPKDVGEPIGSIALMAVSTEHAKAEVGYCIGQRWWGQGIVTEALKAILEYAFLQVGLNRVEAFHHVENLASGRVMVKAGMAQEGYFRQWRCRGGKFADYVFYAMLREDYIGGS